MANRLKGMELKYVWFKKGEFEKLIDAIEGNYKEKVFEIMFKLYERGDLK